MRWYFLNISFGEDNIIATVIFDWDNPEINFPITIENLKKWKIYLEIGEYLFR